MSPSAAVFYLDVQRVEQYCLFKLSWGQGQKLNVEVPYPDTLSLLYQEWWTDYINFYKALSLDGVAEQCTLNTSLRGRVVNNGSFTTPSLDWHTRLVQTQTKLLSEFHQWLRQGELFDIRCCLAQAARDTEKGIEVVLSCNPLNLARLPWETWEIGTEFAAKGSIRLVRTSANVMWPPMEKSHHRRRHRTRILVILGDDTGLDFKAEKEALRSLSKIAEMPTFVGWQPGKDIGELKAEIIEAITDERGWDILFFAGHSNEANLNGGELRIAPTASLFLNEIEQALLFAKEKGLQFAVFNSCKGLDIANTLISLGLSEVAVMREPIHNSVAQEFLVQLLQGLAKYQDAHESFLRACRYLKIDKELTYPSASLVPSLFRHPNTSSFRIEPRGWWHPVMPSLPNKKEAIALAALAFVSWQPQVQQTLIEQRVLVQAHYRQLTNQVPTTKQPPVLLVQVDEESIQKAGMPYPAVPIDRSYLAQLVDKVSAMNARVVGIDYVLDRAHKDKAQDQQFAQSLRNSVQKGTWLVFAAMRYEGGWLGVMPELAQPSWSLQGDVRLFFEDRISYTTLVPRWSSDDRKLPFSYLLSLSYWLNFQQKRSDKVPQPQLQSSVPWLSQLKAHVNDIIGRDYKDLFSPASRLQPLTNSSYLYHQMWLHPVIDFSIPPDRVYSRIPAWKLLESSTESLKFDPHQQQIVIIAPGGHSEAGVNAKGEDNFRLPSAVGYWRSQQRPPDPRQKFPGGEVHAYLIHHFLNQRFVVPIPDLWMIAVAALLGKGAAIALEGVKIERKQRNGKHTLLLVSSAKGKWMLAMASGTLIYGLASLQFYISSAVLLPYVLPVATFWTYIFLNQLERKDRA